MRIIKTCIKANLLPSKIEKYGLSFLILKYVPPGPRKSFILYTYIFYLHNICKWEAGSRVGEREHTLTLKMVMALLF